MVQTNVFKWQRAMTMRKVLQEILEKNPRFHHLTPLKTKHIAHWCRCHGYTPPDPESLRSDGDSIEDVLTQIDSEPGKPSVGLSEQQLAGCGHGTHPSLHLPASGTPSIAIVYPGLEITMENKNLCSPLTMCPIMCPPPVQSLQSYLCPSVVPQPGIFWPRPYSRPLY